MWAAVANRPCGRKRHRMDNFVSANVALPLQGVLPEVSLMTFARLTPVRIALLNLWFFAGEGTLMMVASAIAPRVTLMPWDSRRRRTSCKSFFPKVALLEEMAKLQDDGLIRHRLRPEIDADKAAHGLRTVQCLFQSGIREIEPLLETYRSAACAPNPPATGRSRSWDNRVRSPHRGSARVQPSPCRREITRDERASCGS